MQTTKLYSLITRLYLFQALPPVWCHLIEKKKSWTSIREVFPLGEERTQAKRLPTYRSRSGLRTVRDVGNADTPFAICDAYEMRIIV